MCVCVCVCVCVGMGVLWEKRVYVLGWVTSQLCRVGRCG